jgi:hypothetical protein
MMEDDLRARFARTVEGLVPDPEPYQRLAHRRRRSGRRRTVAGGSLAAALVAGALAVPGVSPLAAGGPDPAPSPVSSADSNSGGPIGSDSLRQLLASPTRGGLGTDYVRGVADTARQRQTALNIAPELSNVAVLFVDDVGTARVALVAFYSTTRVATNWYVADRGATADQLLSQPVAGQGGSGSGVIALDVDTVLSWAGRPGTVSLDALVAVAPANCRIAVAADPAHRQWVAASTGSYLVGAPARGSDWWRVSCGGTVRFEGPARAAAATSFNEPATPAALDAALIGARGTVDRAAANSALLQAGNTELATTGPAHVLWGGDLPGLTVAGWPAAVAAAPVAGGWVVAGCWQHDGVDGAPGISLGTTDVNLGDPRTLFALRPSGDSALVLVLGPREAASVVALVAGQQVARAALTDGTGLLDIAGNGPVTLHALDGHGHVVATYLLGDHADDPDLNPAPAIERW